MSVYILLLTPGTQNNCVVKSCLFAFSLPIFPYVSLSISIYTLVCLCTLRPEPAFLCLSHHTCLYMCLSPLHPVYVTLCDFLVYQPHSLSFFSSSLSISLSPLPHLSLSL